MLRDADVLPLSAGERRVLIYLTRYHRGEVPESGADQILRASDDHETAMKLLALLRAADALDSRTIESPTLVFELNRRHLNITCCLTDLAPKAVSVYGRRKKYRLLEQLLQIEVQVRIVATERLRVVA
jgi:exopolyphosphatase/pppGpp-phosphohydrolase